MAKKPKVEIKKIIYAAVEGWDPLPAEEYLSVGVSTKTFTLHIVFEDQRGQKMAAVLTAYINTRGRLVALHGDYEDTLYERVEGEYWESIDCSNCTLLNVYCRARPQDRDEASEAVYLGDQARDYLDALFAAINKQRGLSFQKAIKRRFKGVKVLYNRKR